MQIIKQDDVEIAEIVSKLKTGSTLVYPTETCYGLGCDATNQSAVNNVFTIKKRQKEKSLLVLVNDVDSIMKYVEWSKTLDVITERYWPGPLTAVVSIKNKVNLPDGVLAADNTIAFRVTSHTLASALCEKLGAPLISTSANIAAQKSPYDVLDVIEMYKDADHKPDIIIDAGVLPEHSPSTVVRIIDDKIEVLRQGEVIIDF